MQPGKVRLCVPTIQREPPLSLKQHGSPAICAPRTDADDDDAAVQETSPPLQLDRSHQYIMLVDRCDPSSGITSVIVYWVPKLWSAHRMIEVLCRRGPTNDVTPACKFTEKVWNAQNAGAVAVIVVNYDDFHTTMVRFYPSPRDASSCLRFLSVIAATLR